MGCRAISGAPDTRAPGLRRLCAIWDGGARGFRVTGWANIPKLNREQFLAYPALCPPLSMQQEFARRIIAVQKLKAAHRASLSELDALFASLQHRAFRGEL